VSARRRAPMPPTAPPLHRVVVEGHRVQRWEIPARTLTVPAVDVDHAREVAVSILHREAGVPGWRPLMRESLTHATAVQARSPHA
jgi:hypothetical protein